MKKLNAFLLGLMNINLFGESYILQDERTDSENIASDWQTIGNDIRTAISQYDDTIS